MRSSECREFPSTQQVEGGAHWFKYPASPDSNCGKLRERMLWNLADMKGSLAVSP